MTDKDFDKRIGDALRGYEEEPPRELFQRIEETLAAAGAAPRKRQRIRHAYGYAVAAALLAGVLVTALYLSRPAGITEEAAVRQTAVVLPDGTGDTAVPDTDAGSEPPQTVSGANTPQPVRAVAKTDGEDTIPERQTAAAGQENAPAGKDTEARDALPAVRESDRNGQRGRSRKRPAYPSPGSAAAELRRNTDAYWERAIAREYGGAPRRKVAGSVYAGNFGTFAGNSVTNDPDRAASAGMLIKQTSDGGMTLQSGLHEENGRPVLAPTGPVTEEVRLQHRMPLNVGLSLSVPLGERLALTTGLNYSYLYSSSEQSFSAGTAHITRELHYIGVPVGLTYTFYRAGGFGFYVQGGGMVEKGVAWRETQGFADAGDSGRESTLRRSKELAGAAPPTDIVYNGFGEITRTDYDGYFEITRDDGVLLRVLEYNGSKEIERGERVYFKYNILPGNGDYVSSYSTPEQTVYDIRVLVFNDIHAVPIVRKSFLLEDDPHRSDSIGHDLIRVVTAAFSGNYINIGFEYFRYENGQPHMINLVWDDTRPATDSVYLELRHNAMGEVEGNGRYVVSDTGLASFRIADLVPEGEESIDIKLKSNMDRKDGVGEYIETEKYHTGTYTTGSTAKTYIVGGELYPPENHTAFVRN